MQRIKRAFVWIFFLCAALFALWYMTAVKDNRINDVLQLKTKSLQRQYQAIYHSFSIASKNVYLSLRENRRLLSLFAKAAGADKAQQKRIRTKMQTMLAKKYTRMRNFGVEQFHFHLPDATSFLRMHKPGKYGDDLSGVRPGVVLANKTKTMQEGFEVGRVVHGFRFIYPLSLQGRHLGSVEISMSSDMLQRTMSRSFENDTGVILHEKIAKSHLWPRDLQNRYRRLPNNQNFFLFGRDANIHLPALPKRLAAYDPFSVYDKDSGQVFSFEPISDITDAPAGYIYSVTSGAQIAAVYRDYYTVMATVSLFFILIAWLLHRDQVYKRTLHETIEQKSRQLHQEHQRMMQQSRLAQMGEMINMIAHQWRQPLSAIASTANSLQLKTSLENFDKAFFARRLDRIASYTQNLSSTVDDFRNFFKPHKEQVEIVPEKICDDAAFIIEFSLNNNHIRLNKSYDCYTKIRTYPSEIRQVVLNLLKNSEEAITQSRQTGGEIGIFTTIKDKDHICITVEDNGGGIKQDCMDKIFDPYFSTKDAKVGTGIGLYMSKMIITKHCGGTLEARNTGSGARFRVTLPIKVQT